MRVHDEVRPSFCKDPKKGRREGGVERGPEGLVLVDQIYEPVLSISGVLLFQSGMREG